MAECLHSVERILQYFQNHNLSADCLYLNIWSPISDIPCTGHKPVMFFTHGGGFNSGSSTEIHYSGQVLATKGDVIVVTINYRINSFGFLYTGTDVAPGNVGLWDQSLALQWVNNNIENFGGDSRKITIFGESAGSVMTSALIISPVTRNLFQNAIMMSGSALGDYTRLPNDVIQYWLRQAALINCTDSEIGGQNKFTPKIINCLKKSSTDDLVKLGETELEPIGSTGHISQTAYLVVDGEFIPEIPLKMLKMGDFKKNLNLLIGNVEDEGDLLLAIYVDPIKYSITNPINTTFAGAFNDTKQLVSALLFDIHLSCEDVAKVYFTGLSDETPQNILRQTVGQIVGDLYITCPTIQFGKTLFNSDTNSNVYEYYFNSKSSNLNPFCGDWMGVCHGSDLDPVFGTPFLQTNVFNDRERAISQQMIDIFSSFAKTGKPPAQGGAEWPQFYKIKGYTFAPYYKITNYPKKYTNFNRGLKIEECDLFNDVL